MNNKIIICLASSRKWSGRCIVGKDIQSGQWIRPISDRPTGEIMLLGKQKYPQPLEILSISTIVHQPHGCQQENYLVSEEGHWKKQGKMAWSQLSNLVDRVTDHLWTNGYSSHHGINDRIPTDIANQLNYSIFLIQPDTFMLEIQNEWGDKKKLRATFSLHQISYKLSVTDPKIERFFQFSDLGKYHFNAKQVYLCLSLTEPFQGHCYKVVASVLFKHWWLPYLAVIRKFFLG